MAMINCPECGKEISDKAESCPNCGFPLKSKNNNQYTQAPVIPTQSINKSSKNSIKQTKKSVIEFISFIAILFIVGGFFAHKNAKLNKETINSSEINANPAQEKTEEQQGIIGVEVQKIDKEKYGIIEDFEYEISGDAIVLDRYTGKCEILEIQAYYIIDDKEYETDLSDFQVGIGNRKVKTLILDEGITEVQDAIFNSCDVKKVYFPKSMSIIYDNTLAYLKPDKSETIKVYYGGTQSEWENIFTEYKRTKIEDAKGGYEVGQSAADKLNEMMGHEYDSSLFEYFFSASPDDLK